MDRAFTFSHQTGRRQAAGLLRRLAGRLRRWQEVSRQREALLQLDERSLRDMGISCHEARAEARRPFWDVPRD